MDLSLNADFLRADAGLVQVRLARIRLDQVGDVGRDGLEVLGNDVDRAVEVVIELGVSEQLPAAVDGGLFLPRLVRPANGGGRR